MSANRPLLTPQEYRGLRMRIQSSRVIAAQMRALDAVPVVLPFSATRQALARHVVDGTENPLSNFWTQGMHRVQSDLTLTGHGYLGYAVITGQRFWRSLSSGDQELLRAAMADALHMATRSPTARTTRRSRLCARPAPPPSTNPPPPNANCFARPPRKSTCSSLPASGSNGWMMRNALSITEPESPTGPCLHTADAPLTDQGFPGC
ncbi:MAG: TRAP transporter substrate-binding protein DctP [Burkholderiaceae bacterium]